MSSRSKEKVTTVIRKLFKGSEKTDTSSDGAGGSGGPSGSPGRRLRRGVSPASNTGGVPVPKPIDTTIRARRLMKEYTEIKKIQSLRPDPVFTVELVNDNLYEWHARLHIVDPDSPLAEDMAELNIPHILLHLIFPENFPFAPPFMRVVEPRIEKGFVMEGGAICMELLTPRGWASAYTVEAVLMQFAASLVKGQGRIARKPKSTKEFSRRSAEEAFRSLVKTHEKYGWVTPALSDGFALPHDACSSVGHHEGFLDPNVSTGCTIYEYVPSWANFSFELYSDENEAEHFCTFLGYSPVN